MQNKVSSRRQFLKSTALGTLALATALPAQTAPAQKPNIVMITAHDLGHHLGCYGVPSVHSPNIDGLAEKGVRFANSYSTCAVCSPGRASLHTGRYPQSNGMMGLIHAPWWWSFKPGERHTAAILTDGGYETMLIGLTHVGNPTKLGYTKALSRRNNADETVRNTAEILAKAQPTDKPFFAKVGFTEVHRRAHWTPDTEHGVFVPGYLQPSDQVKEDLAEYQGSIRFFDDCVGKILKALEKSAVANNTIVVLTSDHGIPYPGAKWCARRAGLTVPLILYKPGSCLTGGKVFQQVISNVDVLPTLLDMIGQPIPENIEGVSFKPFLEGKTKKAPRTEAFGQYTPDMKRDNLSRTIITEDYQLIRYFDQGRTVSYPVDVHPQEFASHRLRCPTSGTRPFVQLYDLKKDPWELKDLQKDPAHKKTVKELSNKLMAWMKAVNDPLLQGPLRTPYYDKSMEDFRATSQQ